MKPSKAVTLAGGKQADLQRIFEKGRCPVTKQAVQQWVRRGILPPRRELQLRRIRPHWFEANGMGKPIKIKPQYPPPKRPPNNLAEARARRGKTKKAVGPPFRPKVYGDPETQI
jgi:hypothetical protein